MQALAVRELSDFVAARPGTQLLDVREAWEVALARIELPAATPLHVPMMQIPSALPAIDRSQPVVCICHHGVRSAHVVAFLLHQGYEDVYNLAGGIDAWSASVDARVARY